MTRILAITIPVTLAIAFLCRPTFLVWAVLLVVACLISHRFGARMPPGDVAGNPDSGANRASRRRIQLAIAIAGVMLVVVSLWTIRNRRQIGAPIWATSHGGYTLLLGNNPSFYDYLRHGDFGHSWDAENFLAAYSHRYDADPRTDEFWHRDWSGDPESTAGISEASDDKLCFDTAISVIRRQPGMFVWSCCVRVGRLWSPMPHLTAGRSVLTVSVVTAYYVTFYLLMAIGIGRLRRRVCEFSYWPILTLALALTAVHSVYWTNLRMRAPVIPGLAVFAAAAFVTSRRVVVIDAPESWPEIV